MHRTPTTVLAALHDHDGHDDLATGARFDRVNGDRSGFDDLAIGVPGEAIGPGEPGAGPVNIVAWSQDSRGIKDMSEARDHFGIAVTP